MKLGAALCCGAMLAAGCGGGGGEAPGPSGLAWAGMLEITSAPPVGTTTCLATTDVTFGPSGADRNAVSVEGGACVRFVNQDTTVRRPGPAGATPCAELSGTSLSQGQSFTTPPLAGPRTCLWQDALHPVPAGGGGGY